MAITILLVDDHTILRQGVRVLLESEPDFEVIGEASTGPEAWKKVQALHPDVIVLDLAIPEMSGLEITHRIQENQPSTRVVILSMHAKEAYVLEALKHGASAYVLKGSEAWELIHAIRQAMQGNRYLSPPFSERGIETYLKKTQSGNLDPFNTLTPREREIMHLAAEGLSNHEIAYKLTISQRTVEVHRARVMHKLNLQNQAELIHLAIAKGMIPIAEKQNPDM